MDNPGAIAGFIIGFTCLILAMAITTYVLISRRQKLYSKEWNSSADDARRALSLGREQLFEESHSFTNSWSGSSGPVDVSSTFRHLPSPENPVVNGTDNRLSNTNHTIKGLGKIQFTVAYRSNVQELQISVLRCVELPQLDPALNTVDSYVKLELLPEKRHRVKTRVVRASNSPFFGEAFTMNQIPLGLFKAGSLHFIIVGFDRHSRDSVIGEVVCPLSELNLNLTKEVTLTRDILKRKFSVSLLFK